MSPAATLERPQPLQALALANQVRTAGAELKRDLADGKIGLAGALRDPRAQGVPAVNLLIALPGVGKVRARKVLTSNHIVLDRRVRDLTGRQRELLVEAFA